MDLKFGILEDLTIPVSFAAGRIEPEETANGVRDYLDENLHKEGWLYPHNTSTYRVRWNPVLKTRVVDDEALPNTERPAFLRRLPPTHVLVYTGQMESDSRRVVPGILLRALAFFLGTRLQFSDWGIDLRIRVRNRQTPFSFWTEHHYAHDLPIMLGQAYAKTCRLEDRQRLVLLNTLTTHSRAATFEWAWERFMWHYVAVEGCWNLLIGDRHFPHGERLTRLCADFGIPYSEKDLEDIVELRNDLAHEALWHESPLGTHGSPDAVRAGFKLAKLVDRLLMFALEIPCGFRTTVWTSHSQIGLDLAR